MTKGNISWQAHCGAEINLSSHLASHSQLSDCKMIRTAEHGQNFNYLSFYLQNSVFLFPRKYFIDMHPFRNCFYSCTRHWWEEASIYTWMSTLYLSLINSFYQIKIFFVKIHRPCRDGVSGPTGHPRQTAGPLPGRVRRVGDGAWWLWPSHWPGRWWLYRGTIMYNCSLIL